MIETEKTAVFLNQVYNRLELKRAEITHALFHRICKADAQGEVLLLFLKPITEEYS